jgi:hypothetical protein
MNKNKNFRIQTLSKIFELFPVKVLVETEIYIHLLEIIEKD